MPALSHPNDCTIEVLRTGSGELQQFQIEVACKKDKGNGTYRLEVNKTGQSGTTASSQSGKIHLKEGLQRAGNVKVNMQERDTVRVNAQIRDDKNQVIADCSSLFPSQ